MLRYRSQVSPTLTRALELLLVVLLFLAPVIISTRLKQVFNTPKYVLVGLVAVVLASLYAVDCLFERRLRLPRNRGAWFLLGFLGWAGLSLLWSSDMAVASRDFGYHSALVMIFLAAFLYGREEERVDNLLHFPIAGGVLAAGFGLLQYYQLDEVVLRGRSVAPILLVSGGLMAGLTALRDGGAGFRRACLPLVLLVGVAAGFNDVGVQFLGLIVTGIWFFLRSLEPGETRLGLALRIMAGLLAILLSSLIDGQVILVLALAILLDEEASSEEDIGPALLATGLLAVGITAAMQRWDLSFLILPKKPAELVKIYSFMGHRNYLAGFLIAVLPLAVVRLIATWCVVPPCERGDHLGRLRRSGVYLLAVSLMGAVLMLTHTRGAWIGAIVSLGFLTCWILVKFMPLRPYRLLSLVGAALFVVMLVFGWKRLALPGGEVVENPFNLHTQSAGSRLAETLNIQGGSAFQRALIYRTTWHIIFDHPVNALLGTGIGTFGLHYMPAQREVLEIPSNRKYVGMINKSIYAHNEYWHYWSEVGLVGLLLLFGAAYSIARAAHLRLRAEPPSAPALMFLGMCASLVATATHNFFTFDFHLAYSGAVFFALAGMVLAQSDGEFWVLSWGAGERLELDSPVGPMTLELESMDGHVVGRLEGERPWGPGEASLVLHGPDRVKVDAAPDPEGRLVVAVPEVVGARYRLEVEGLELPTSTLTLETGPGRPVEVVVGVVLVGFLQVVAISSLADDVFRDMYWRDGFLKFRGRRFEEAFLDFERAVKADPTKGEVLFDFGRSLMDSGRNVPAIKVFEQAKATFVDPANDHNIALCYFKEGEVEEAEAHYRRAIHLNEIYEQSLANLGFLLIQQGRHEEAMPILEKGAKHYPRNPSFPTSLGMVLGQQKKYAEAATYFDRALKLKPNKASIFQNAGTVYFNNEEYQKAEDAFARALSLNPDDERVKRKMVMLQLTRWGKVATEDPQNVEARRNYAAALLAAGHVGPAATEARNILSALPGDHTARYTYARALEAQGYRDEARAEYRRMLAGAPADHPLRSDAQKRMLALAEVSSGGLGPPEAAPAPAPVPGPMGPIRPGGAPDR